MNTLSLTGNWQDWLTVGLYLSFTVIIIWRVITTANPK